MTERCVEVTVSFGSTLVHVALVRRGERCIVGRTRDADIALDVAPWTFVDSTPHGFVADGAPLDTAPVVRAFGAVTLTAVLVERPRASLPRRRIEGRPFAYGALSVAVHAVVLAGALGSLASTVERAPASDASRGRPVKLARFAVAAQTVRRAPVPPPETTPVTTDDTPSAMPEPSAPVVPADGVPATGLGERAPAIGAEPTHFDPSTSPAFDTVKVGDYATLSTGRAAGDDYELAGANGNRKPILIISCDAATCLVLGGGSENDHVRRALESRLPEITACYAAHAATAGKKVELDFGIDDAGKVAAVNVGGVGDYDSCVAGIIQGLDLAAR